VQLAWVLSVQLSWPLVLCYLIKHVPATQMLQTHITYALKIAGAVTSTL